MNVQVKSQSPPTSMRRRVLGGSFWAILGVGVTAAVGFISVPLTLSYLGKERMGLWRLALSTLVVVSFLRAGLVPHLKTRMAEAYAEKNARAFEVFSSTGCFIGLCFLVMGLLLAAAAPLVDWRLAFNIDDPQAGSEAMPLMVILIVYTFAQMGSIFLETIFDARLEVSKPRIYATIGNLLGFFMLLGGMWMKVDLPTLALLSVAPPLLSRVPLLVELAMYHRSMITPCWRELPRLLKEMIGSCTIAMGVQLGSVVIGVLPNVFVAHYLSLSEVTTFSISLQLATYPLLALSATMPVFWPAFTVLWKRGDRERLRIHLLKAVAATSGALLLYIVFLGLLGSGFVSLWTGGRLSPPPLLLVVLGLFAVVEACGYWLSTFLWSTNELVTLLVSVGATAIVFAALGLWLPRICGAYGIGAAMGIGTGVGSVLLMGWRTRRKLREAPLPSLGFVSAQERVSLKGLGNGENDG
jgi:O-antigen/teichoic acid export membrane protein